MYRFIRERSRPRVLLAVRVWHRRLNRLWHRLCGSPRHGKKTKEETQETSHLARQYQQYKMQSRTKIGQTDSSDTSTLVDGYIFCRTKRSALNFSRFGIENWGGE